ncbi:MAG TPA: hypothetical protein VFI84_00245 [Candidatus Saccharimonadales bacterium]|nr:hypothetical protein [Candidatus Saccharimonadales bacterium]
MFEKLLANLPYNPSLVHQLGFYAKRMRREESIRRTGLVFLVLAFLVQFFAVLNPPQPTVADSVNDLINNGISSASNPAAYAATFCKDNTRHYKDILVYYGITCAEVANAGTVTIKSTDYDNQLYSMGWKDIKSTFNGKKTYQQSVTIPNAGTLYWRKLSVWDTIPFSTYKALKIPATAKHGTFWILYNCGNLVHIKVPSPYVPPAPVTPPPPPPPPVSLACSNLVMNYEDNQTVQFGSAVIVRGQAASANVQTGQTADMRYDYVDTATNKVLSSQTSLKVPFVGSTADDTQTHTFTASKSGTFAIKLIVSSGNIQLAAGSGAGNCIKHFSVAQPCIYNSALSADSPECKPCDTAVSSQDTLACLVLHKSANDTTAGWTVDNDEVKTANPGDSITYTLTTKNDGKAAIKQYTVQEDMSDVLDYTAKDANGNYVIDLHGGTMDSNGLVSWPTIDYAPGATVTHQITIQVANPIPATPVSASDASRFDLLLTNTYNNTINIKVPAPVTKQIETSVAALPNTGPGSSLVLIGAIVIVAGYFFARARLLADESMIAVRQTSNHGGM